MKDVRRIVRTYFAKLFDPKTSDIVCVSSSTTVDNITTSFREEGFQTVLKSLEDVA